MCIALGIRNQALPTTHWKVLQERGGFTPGSVGDFLLWCHSTMSVKALRSLESRTPSVHLSEFQAWVRRKAPKLP